MPSPTPTRDELAGLLAIRDEAKSAMSRAYAACAAGEKDTLEARLSLDLDRKRALLAYCAADSAYDTALNLFMAAQKVAA